MSAILTTLLGGALSMVAGEITTKPPINGEIYPALSIASGHQGMTVLAFDIDREGVVSNCQVVRSSGDNALDKAGCQIVQRRAPYPVSTDSKGNPRPLSSTLRVHWVLAGIHATKTDSRYDPEDVIIFHDADQINADHERQAVSVPVRPSFTPPKFPRQPLKAGASGSTFALISVDRLGRVSNCTVVQQSGNDVLDKKACDFGRRLLYKPSLDAAGKPLYGVDLLRINWLNPGF